ncbi:MAG: CdaR family protein, partial [Polaribacter sp.]
MLNSNHTQIRKLSKAQNKISKTFVGFLIASILIWFLITFSKVYVATITFPVKYTEISQDKLLESPPLKAIDITVKASGFKILKARLNAKELQISAKNLRRKAGTTHFLLIKNQLNAIQKQLPSGIELRSIQQDTLFLDVGTLLSKKIPLHSNTNVKFHIGYGFSEPIKISPDSITVSGPETLIKNLDKLELASLKLTDVKSDFEQKVSILKPKKATNLKYTLKEATISGKVEKFTEGTLELSYRITNVPKGIKLITLPKKVSVIFVTGLSNFGKIDASSFKIECNYSVSIANNLNYLIPKMIHTSQGIKSYKIV